MCYFLNTARNMSYEVEIRKTYPEALGFSTNGGEFTTVETPGPSEVFLDTDQITETGPFPTIEAVNEAYRRWLDNDDTDTLQDDRYSDLFGKCEVHTEVKSEV